MEIHDLFSIKSGLLLKKEFRNEFGVKILLSKSINEFNLLDEDELEDYGDIKNLTKNKLQTGDIVVENKEPFRVLYIEQLGIPYDIMVASNFLVLRRNEEKSEYNLYFIFLYLQSDLIKEHLRSIILKKSVIAKNDIGEIELPNTSLQEQEVISQQAKKYNDITNNFFKRIKREKEQLKEMKKGINSKLNKIIVGDENGNNL